MGSEHAPETVWRAQELYCVDRLSYEAVAERMEAEGTPVAVSSLKRWGDKYGWRVKREELAQAAADIRADTLLARSKMLKKLIDAQDAQTSFAVASLESLAMKQAEAARAGKMMEAARSFELREIRTQEDAVDALQEAVELKLNRLLADPASLDFKAVSDIRKALTLVAEMKAQHAPDKGKERGTTAQLEQLIREFL